LKNKNLIFINFIIFSTRFYYIICIHSQLTACELNTFYSNNSSINKTVIDTNLTDTIDEVDLNKLLPWRSSMYLAAGYGFPQGLRGELGYNFGHILSFGLTFGIFDYWSRDPGEGTFGMTLKLFLPYKSLSFTPYLMYSSGGTFSIFGHSDSYTLFYFGSMFTIKSWLHVRPEIGVVFTSRYIPIGTSIFNLSPSVNTEDKQHIGLNLSFELDIRQIF
jgi:hypothetical protein